MFLSNDNGSTWAAFNNGLTNTSVTSLAVSGTNLFAGTYGSGVFVNSTVLTGIVEEANNDFQFSIYPNPSTGNFSINLFKQSPLTEVTITNAFGQEVSREKFNNASKLNMEIREVSGLYFVKVSTGNKTSVFKVVKL